jgi:hypothetical protein
MPEAGQSSAPSGFPTPWAFDDARFGRFSGASSDSRGIRRDTEDRTGIGGMGSGGDSASVSLDGRVGVT